jgi:hypothetical protein
MSHGKRTKKDVEEAYRRGFQDGFNVRPNPLSMILRSIWRKHELKKLRKAWERKMKETRGISPVSLGFNSTQPIGIVKNFREDEHGLSAEIELKGPDDV